MTLSVHLFHVPDDEVLDYLRARLDPKVQITLGADIPSPAEYCVFVAGRPQREHLEASPNLHTLVIPWAGLPVPTRELMASFPHIAVYNLHHNALPVAEMAITLMLAAAKCIVPIDRSLRAHDWTPRYRPVSSVVLDGKTALILGYGAIGQHVARMCRGLGMKVIASRRDVTAPATVIPDEIHPPQALQQLLPRAHVLIIALPHTPVTDGLIGADELSSLPPGALLVNVGRGAIVQEDALYHALHDGVLHAAGLDVWYNYPPDETSRAHTAPSTFPFHELDNVVMSPHRASASTGKETRRMDYLAQLLNAIARRDPIPNRVDLEVGY